MTPDEVVKELEALYKTGNNFLEADEPKALLSAISLIQDYQKLREKLTVEGIKKVLSAEHELKARRIAEQIVTYLQQPTEH